MLSVEDQEALRGAIEKSVDLVGFVVNGAVLPRASGASDLPLASEQTTVVRFQSPPSLERGFALPNQGKVKGMGIPKGVTLIVGIFSLACFHLRSTHLSSRGSFPCVLGPSKVTVRTR